MLPSKTIYTDGIRAGLMVREPPPLWSTFTSILTVLLRLGEVGGTRLFPHPRYRGRMHGYVCELSTTCIRWCRRDNFLCVIL